MDDVPSRPDERSKSEREADGRGFYDLGTDFAVLHLEIAKGVQDAVGKQCSRDDFLDVLQKVDNAAWERWSDRPGCFAPGSLRKFARKNARWRLADLKEERRRNAIGELAVQREYAAGNFDVALPDSAIEEEERQRAFAGALQKLDTNSLWAIIEVYYHRLTHREAAAELGVSKAKIGRWLAKAFPILRRELKDFDPRASHRPSATPPTIPPTRRS
jgi:RNA polymerase sigma factor (sigma-70 family)